MRAGRKVNTHAILMPEAFISLGDPEEEKKEELLDELPSPKKRPSLTKGGAVSILSLARGDSHTTTKDRIDELRGNLMQGLNPDTYELFYKFHQSWGESYGNFLKSTTDMERSEKEKIINLNDFLSDLRYLDTARRSDKISDFENFIKKIKNTADYYNTEATFLKRSTIYNKLDWILSTRTFTISFITTLYTLYGRSLNSAITFVILGLWVTSTTLSVLNRIWQQNYLYKLDEKKQSIEELNIIYNKFHDYDIQDKDKQFALINFITLYTTNRIFSTYGKKNLDKLSIDRTINSMLTALLEKRCDEHVESRRGSVRFGDIKGEVKEMEYTADNISAISSNIFYSIKDLIKETEAEKGCLEKCFGYIYRIFQPRYCVSLSHYDVLLVIQEKVNAMALLENPDDSKVHHKRSSSGNRTIGRANLFKSFRFLFDENILDRSDEKILVNNAWRSLVKGNFIKVFADNGVTEESDIFKGYQTFIKEYDNKYYLKNQTWLPIIASALIGITDFAEFMKDSLWGYLGAIAVFWSVASIIDKMVVKRVKAHEEFQKSIEKVRKVFTKLAQFGLIDAVQCYDVKNPEVCEVEFRGSFATHTIFTIVERVIKNLEEQGVNYNKLPAMDKAMLINQCIISIGNVFTKHKDIIELMKLRKTEADKLKKIFKNLLEQYEDYITEEYEPDIIFQDLLDIVSKLINEKNEVTLESIKANKEFKSLLIKYPDITTSNIIKMLSQTYKEIQKSGCLLEGLKDRDFLGRTSKHEIEIMQNVATDITAEIKGYIMKHVAKNDIPQSFFYREYNCCQKICNFLRRINLTDTFANFAIHCGQYCNVFSMCCSKGGTQSLNYGKLFNDIEKKGDNLFGATARESLKEFFMTHVETASPELSKTAGGLEDVTYLAV